MSKRRRNTASKADAALDDSVSAAPPFPVVGIGASAGGVAALTTFFEHMPPDSAMAFVVILHLPPDAQSNLSAILQRHTTMPVAQLAEPVRIQPNRIYVLPPDQQIVIVDGALRLADTEPTDGAHLPVDHFLRALADACDGSAAAVILSGAGSDGALGLGRIKEAGGVTLAQNPQEAEYDGMPRAAISTGLVDFVQPVAELPPTLINYWRRGAAISAPVADAEQQQAHADTLREIFAILRVRTGHDFSQYKRPTVNRRINRRLQVTGAPDFSAYLALLRSRPEEVQALLNDLLISVTNFFRDRDAWTALQAVIPQLFADKGPNDQVRVWVAACATGEEAYSVAMLLREWADTLEQPPTLQVFATDIDDEAIVVARQGLYPNTIAGDVSPARLARFFVPDHGGYRIKQDVRDLVLFARHNILHDPPFSRVDLITCRNLLIYLNHDAQAYVLRTFHFSLRTGGYLLLGSSESIDGAGNLFTIVDKTSRVFQRGPGNPANALPAAIPVVTMAARPSAAPPSRGRRADLAGSFGELHGQLIAEYTPPSVIVNPDGDIVHLGRGVGQYLHFGEGEPSQNLLKVVLPALRLDLHTAFIAARQQNQRMEARRVAVALDGAARLVDLIVQPLAEPEWARGYLQVVFHDVGEVATLPVASPSTADALVTQLEAELDRTRLQLRATVEQYEAAVEEYKAANEELQAINEELRAASEELETSKEELQSINEELTTVNQELKHKVDEISRANNDLQNLIASTQIGTIFLDRELRIKRYTPSTQAIFNLIPSDLNRPLNHVTHSLRYDSIAADTAEVLETLTTLTREVQTTSGQWYLLRLLPYRTIEDRIDGVVLTFVDITERKRAEDVLRASEQRLQRMVNVPRVGVLTFDYTGALLHANDAFLDMAGYDRAEFEAQAFTWHDFTPLEHVDASMRVMEQLRATGRGGPYEKEYFRKDGSRVWMMFVGADVGDGTIVEYAIDINAQKRAEAALRDSEARLAADLAGMRRLYDLHAKLAVETNLKTALEEIIAAACEFTRTDRGCVQFVSDDGERLEMFAWRGYTDDSPFINHFRYEGSKAACDMVRRHMTRFITEDIEKSPLFAGTQDRAVALADNIRAAQSTPMISRSGELIGVLSTQFRQPHRPGDDQLRLIDLLAWMAADFVERHRAEAALRASEQRLQALIEHLPGGAVFIVDRNLRYLIAEGEAIAAAGLTPEQLVGYTIHEALLPELAAQYELIYRSALAGEPFEHEHDAHGRTFISRGVPLRGANGDIYAVLAVSYDITERKQAEAERERLLAAEQAARAEVEAALQTRDQFLSIASHELRTPLTSLIGYAYMLRATTAQGQNAADLADLIGRQAQRLNSLIDQLLDVSRLQQGQFAVERRPLDLAALVAQVVDEFRISLPSNTRHPVELRRPDAPVPVAGDAPRLEQVIVNLLTNAVKYSPDGGAVRVRIVPTTTEAVLEVEDQGIGIPADTQARLFEPFYRARNVGSQASGFGLGLHIVREIVVRHGGRVEVESAEGRGSTFRVVLPLDVTPALRSNS